MRSIPLDFGQPEPGILRVESVVPSLSHHALGREPRINILGEIFAKNGGI